MTNRLSGDKIVSMHRRQMPAVHPAQEHDQLAAIDNNAIVDGLFSLLEGTPGLATITDIDGALLYMNDHGREALGIAGHAAVNGRLLSDNYPEDDAEYLFQRAIPYAIDHGTWRGEMTMVDTHGGEIPVSQVIIFQHTSANDGFLLSIAWDMRKEKNTEKVLRHRATHDELTGLPNRSLIVDRLGQALNAAQREKKLAAVVFMDIDRFKSLNDDLGHETANRILHDLSERLASCIRSVDTIGRYGGDEFVLVLPNLNDRQHVAPVLDRIRKSLSTPFSADDRQVTLTMSTGVAMYPEDGTETGALLHRADQDMYREKRRRAARAVHVSGTVKRGAKEAEDSGGHGMHVV